MGVGVGGVVNYANVSSGTASDVVAYGGIGGPYEYVSFFSVLNWFSKGEQGAWYDPSDLTTLFQDSAGTTPVTLSPMEQPVGLMRDKSGRGNHAFQATAGNRPLLSARVNLLTKTEDFGNSPWGGSGYTVSANTIIAPDGTQTADTITLSLIGAYITEVVTVTPSTVYTFTFYVLRGTATDLKYSVFDYTNTTNIVAQTSYYSQTSSTVWSKITVSFTTPSGCTSLGVYPSRDSNALGTVHLWGADLRPTNSGALLPPYQRVNTATDYDTVGFPLYLKCNGSSSAMSTNSINFTATDKMTVVTGVRKLSDAVAGMLMELSATATGSSSNTIFHITTPDGTTPTYSFLLRRTTYAARQATGVVSPITSVLSCRYNGAESTTVLQILPRVNGSIPTLTAHPLAPGPTEQGVFSNDPIYLFARGGTSLPLNGQFYGAIIRGAQSDTNSVVQTENYMAKQTGITF